jgi:hypothetical protein
MTTPEQILAGFTMAGSYLVMVTLARGRRYGWLVSIGNQGLWLALGILTMTWAFIGGAFAFGAIAIHGYRNWKGIR